MDDTTNPTGAPALSALFPLGGRRVKGYRLPERVAARWCRIATCKYRDFGWTTRVPPKSWKCPDHADIA